jgi:hypothetical protein
MQQKRRRSLRQKTFFLTLKLFHHEKINFYFP